MLIKELALPLSYMDKRVGHCWPTRDNSMQPYKYIRQRAEWESNPSKWFCRPLPNRLVIRPREVEEMKSLTVIGSLVMHLH